ncbi:hypothetical protein QFC19_005333 [Naganishia cerealis]|uniref:Uncharacterized protein n=1 Tax=Naganishia cerealis TaxID=610337 RepID=A0ACC2VR20_9TREE|nr:hypothetical protein QFC19_005333 [Naganishia cerealis]
MSTSVAHLNAIATGPTGAPSTTTSNHFSTAASVSTDANGQPIQAAGLGGLGEATEPLMRFLLNGRNANFFSTLYANEAVCLGMFRLLPPIPRQLVMSLLWSSTNLRAKDLKVLVGMSAHAPNADFEHRLSPLVSLGILAIEKHRGVQYVHMHAGFRLGLRNALANGGKSNAFGVSYVPSEGDRSLDPPPTIDELVEHGNSTWEAMLKYMVSSRLDALGAVEDRPQQEVLDTLIESGLMAEAENCSCESLSVRVQAKLRHGGDDGVEILKLFFTLGNMQLGRGYSASALSPAQSAILDDLEAYGLIYSRYVFGDGKRHDQFFPTGLATTLCSGASGVTVGDGMGSAADGGKGFLILETNYKIYAYTSNELQIAILNLFVDIRVRYPNLIVGKLERDTVKRAMEEGITAGQVRDA